MEKGELPKIVSRGKKRVGRGIGSGKGGHTTGRGQKGQKARSHLSILFTGMKVKKSVIKRLPLARGKGKFGSGKKPVVVNLAVLNLLDAGAVVDEKLLTDANIVDKEAAAQRGIKILGGGTLTKKLTISLPISKSAAEKVKKAGGKVT